MWTHLDAAMEIGPLKLYDCEIITRLDDGDLMVAAIAAHNQRVIVV